MRTLAEFEARWGESLRRFTPGAYESRPWRPVHRLRDGMGEFWLLPEPCRCDRRLTQPHTEPTCPYVDPDDWYAAEVARMAERAPA